MAKNKHIHILGIAGTFMASLAIIARQLGFKVTGQDSGVYPPMSTQLKNEGIDFLNGYEVSQMPKADLYVIGNALSRGNKCVEEILEKRYSYTSGAQFLSENVLKDKWVLAVSGTHGKTSTVSMLVWILEFAKLNPSFLCGGVMQNFSTSARLTKEPFFVIEADEYDTAFFDKRSKFVHYQPSTLVINNLEFDHADIFNSLDDIKKQFHHLLRIVPKNGLIVSHKDDKNVDDVLKMGCWSKTQKITNTMLNNSQKGSTFPVIIEDKNYGNVDWELLGEHNKQNALCAIYAARHIGITPEISIKALAKFKGIKRRLEIIQKIKNTIFYDDFAHHPTAISTTLEGLRKKVGDKNIIVILELRSNTMKMGFHQKTLLQSLDKANKTIILNPNQDWLEPQDNILIVETIDDILSEITKLDYLSTNHIVIMSNGGFNGIYQKIKEL